MEMKDGLTELLEIDLPLSLMEKLNKVKNLTGKSKSQITVELLERFLNETEHDRFAKVPHLSVR